MQEQTDACERAFKELKETVAIDPILAHFDRAKTVYIEADALDAVVSGVLSQKDAQGIL